MTDYTITNVQARTATSYLAGDREGIYARVEFPSGTSYEVSQLYGETAWTVDASWGKGSFPHWCNGYGARYLMTKVIADAGLILALDAARDALRAMAVTP
jgi:hypothetical protein